MKPSLPEAAVAVLEPAGVLEGGTTPAPRRFAAGRIKDWLRLLTRFLSFELLIQAMSFAAGVLLVRVLPKAEYAYFTIANTMQQTMNLLADNGVSSGLTAIGGRVWDDRSRFGQLLATAMRLRRVLAVAAIVTVTPLLAWMLTEAGAKPIYTSLICGAVLLGLYFQLTIGVLIVAPRLHLEVNRVQHLNFWSSVLRLALIVGAYLMFPLNAVVALFAAAVSFGMQEWLLRRWRPRYAETGAPTNAGDQKEILSIVKNQAPNAIYYCIQSQLMVWLISIFGSTHSVAEVGALGRLSMIFVVMGSVMMNVVLPRFARVQDPQTLWRRYWQIVGASFALDASLLFVAAFFPEALLWILGPKYAHLQAELFLMILGTVLASVLGTMYSLNCTKGWIVSPWLLIPIGVTTELILIFTLDLSKVRGVLLLAIYSTIPGFFLNYWRARRGIREQRHAAAPPV